MKPLKTIVMLALCSIILPMAQEAVSDQLTLKPSAKPQLKVQPIRNLKFCPDLKTNLTLTKNNNGMVSIHGTVTNVGKGDYKMASLARVIMNLSYAPKYSYNMTGVSDILTTKPFTTLKAGASIPVNASFKIPDFGGWASGSVQGNAKRLFTLGAIKQDMSSYKAGEECNQDNNSTSEEVAYKDTGH
jgi:hypothetical protein